MNYDYDDLRRAAGFSDAGKTLRQCPKCYTPKMMAPADHACLQCVMDEMQDMIQQAAGMRGTPFYDDKPWAGFDFGKASTGTTRAADAGFTSADWADLKRARTAQEKLDKDIQKAKTDAYRRQQQEQAWQRAARAQEEAFRQSFFSDFQRKRQEEQRAAPPPPPRRAVETVDLDLPMLRRLLQLCHPDKHANSLASQTATHFLLGLKDALERSQR